MKKTSFVIAFSIIILLAFVTIVQSESISNLQASPESVASLRFGEDTTISFNYRTNEPGGVRIFVRPFTAGAATPNYAASGSPVYPTGTGSGTGSFTILSGDMVVVDQLRFRMTNADQSRLLLEFFVPVQYVYSAHSITNIRVFPVPPSYSTFGEQTRITFRYTTTEAGGVRIFVRPFTRGAATPNYSASGSPLYPVGSGVGDGDFTIMTGDVLVDSLHFTMYNANQSRLLLEFYLPVRCSFVSAP